MKRSLCLVVLLAVCCIAPAARADVIYSNFGPGDTSDPFGSFLFFNFLGISDYDMASGFSPSNNYTFDSVEVAVWLAGYGDPSLLTLWLMTDTNGVPDTVLESLEVAVLTGGQRIVTAASSLRPVLTAGERYWVGASATPMPGYNRANIVWNVNSVQATGSKAFRNSVGPWTAQAEGITSALRVSGTPAAVPEPASLLLLGTGLAGLARWRKRRG